jgi:biopolymer transport protein ExbB
MSFNLAEVFSTMQPFALAIVAVLALMATMSISVLVERMWVYYRSRKQSKLFAVEAAKLLQAGDHAGLVKAAGKYRGCHLASLLASGVRTYADAVKEPGELGPMELTRREMMRKSEAMSADVRRGHNILASVGSVAPFVGLLGTVIGIISAFQGIATEGSGGLGAVSAGIAEALIATAIGLFVAIPSVLAFNFLSARCDSLLIAIDQAKGEFLDYLENQSRGQVAAGSGGTRITSGTSELVVGDAAKVSFGATA